MTIILTKKINGKEAKLDLISLNGKATVRDKSMKELKKKGINKKELREAGFEVEPTI